MDPAREGYSIPPTHRRRPEGFVKSMKSVNKPATLTIMAQRPHTKHAAIYEEIIRSIADGRFGPGSRLPTEAELVRHYKTSRPTITRVMQRLVQEGLVLRKTGAGTFVRNDGGVARPKVFGLLIPGLGDTEIFEPICGQIARDADAHRYTLLWGDSNGPAESISARSLELARRYVQERVAGVFFAPLEFSDDRDDVNAAIVETLEAASVPVILLDRDIGRYPDRSRYDIVSIDHRRAAHLLVRHMIDSGEKSVGFIARPQSAPSVAQRIAGYRDALREAAKEPAANAIHFGDPSDRGFVRGILRARAERAFVCANDVTAAHFMHTLDELGVRVPADVRVAGFDDVRYASLLRVPLTTVHQPCREIGTAAMQAMVERLACPQLPARDILVSSRLVVRKSTKG